MKILMVENHKEFAKIVIDQFMSSHEVEVAPSIANAQKMLEKTKYDAVFVDYDLDDGKGVTLVQIIRKKMPDTPILGISAFEEKNKLLVKAGANSFCIKTKFHEISTIINQWEL